MILAGPFGLRLALGPSLGSCPWRLLLLAPFCPPWRSPSLYHLLATVSLLLSPSSRLVGPAGCTVCFFWAALLLLGSVGLLLLGNVLDDLGASSGGHVDWVSPTSWPAPSLTGRRLAQSLSWCRWRSSFLFSSRVPGCPPTRAMRPVSSPCIWSDPPSSNTCY